jgi:D-threo-aldose 1-dehydrogenase
VIPGLTEFSLGCAQPGNLYRAIPDEQAHATVDAAWEAGVRYFDTAPHYGLGLSERRLGEALAGRPREEYILPTKGVCGLRPGRRPFRLRECGGHGGRQVMSGGGVPGGREPLEVAVEYLSGHG